MFVTKKIELPVMGDTSGFCRSSHILRKKKFKNYCDIMHAIGKYLLQDLMGPAIDEGSFK